MTEADHQKHGAHNSPGENGIYQRQSARSIERLVELCSGAAEPADWKYNAQARA